MKLCYFYWFNCHEENSKIANRIITLRDIYYTILDWLDVNIDASKVVMSTVCARSAELFQLNTYTNKNQSAPQHGRYTCRVLCHIHICIRSVLCHIWYTAFWNSTFIRWLHTYTKETDTLCLLFVCTVAFFFSIFSSFFFFVIFVLCSSLWIWQHKEQSLILPHELFYPFTCS